MSRRRRASDCRRKLRKGSPLSRTRTTQSSTSKSPRVCHLIAPVHISYRLTSLRVVSKCFKNQQAKRTNSSATSNNHRIGSSHARFANSPLYSSRLLSYPRRTSRRSQSRGRVSAVNSRRHGRSSLLLLRNVSTMRAVPQGSTTPTDLTQLASPITPRRVAETLSNLASHPCLSPRMTTTRSTSSCCRTLTLVK